MIFVGKTVLITGASRGIGQILCQNLAGCGMKVWGVARSEAGLERTKKLVEADGGHFIGIPFDLSDTANIGQLVKSLPGTPNYVVNNAGIEEYNKFQNYSHIYLQALLNTNLLAPMELTRQLLPAMIKRGSGHIVNIASLAGKVGVPFNAPYSASKGGLVLWTDALRQELHERPVNVSVVCPGYITDVGMFHESRGESSKLLGTSAPARVADAVVDCILNNRAQVIVNQGPIRPLLALAQIFPRLADRLIRYLRVPQMNRSRINALKSKSKITY